MTGELLSAIEDEITKLSFGEPKELYDPIQYIMQLGGKRIRPLLCLLSYNLFKEDWASIVRQATALEVFHNFTLMHDDIMDNAPLRRGKQTIHEKWGANTGILSGDVMFVKAYELISESPSEFLPAVMKAFNACATAVCEGQQIDMNFEKVSRVEEDEYLQMITRKTAALLGFSVELGGILSNRNSDTQNKLHEYGLNLGIAFQLTDDYLDVYGDSKKFGKQWGGDIISNKKTYLLIKALQKADDEDQKSLNEWLEKENFNAHDKIQAIMAIYDRLEIKEDVEQEVNKYFLKATAILDALPGVDASKKELLAAFTESLKSREK